MIEDLFSSDINSMFSRMDQRTVCDAVKSEIQFAAQLVNANSFFVVLYVTIHGNSTDEACWYDANLNVDPTTRRSPALKRAQKGIAYSVKRICQLVDYVVHHAYVTLGSSVQHQITGIPQVAHSNSFLANLTCYHFETRFVEKFPFHTLQYNIFRYCDDFEVANAPYFKEMYRDIYPASSVIVLIPNEINPREGFKVESHFLDTLTCVTHGNEVHIVTLFDKRSSYDFFVNRFPDVDSTASETQSHSVFYGELVRIF